MSVAVLRVAWRAQPPLALALLAALLVLTLVAALGIGAYSMSPAAVIGALLAGPAGPDPAQQVMWSIRVPRVLLAAAAGGALGVAGCTIQALFRNPLADPTLVGISSGAALGAAGVIFYGATLQALLPPVLAALLLPLAAFAGSLAVATLALSLATRTQQLDVALLLLVGIAINALALATVGLFQFLSDDQALRDFTFWSLGSVAGATWRVTVPAALCVALGTVVVLAHRGALNAFALGERDAHYLGVDTERAKWLLMIAASLMVGAAVAATGIIAFVGLVVPHLARLITGADHRHAVPAAALLGAALLLGADLLARTVLLPAELPVGVVTALLGAPCFLWLLYRHRARAWP